MSNSNYKFTYFNVTAKGETSRMLMALAGIAFKDIRLTGEEWAKLKPKTPFGQLPTLEVDGITLCQSKAIERLIAKRYGPRDDQSLVLPPGPVKVESVLAAGFYGRTDMEQAKADMVIDCLEDVRKPLIQLAFAPEEQKPELKKTLENEKAPPMMANLENMVNPSGHFIGDKISWPDVDCYNVVTFAKNPAGVDLKLNKHPKLKTLLQNVENNPKIAEWLKKRPETKF